MMPDITVEPSDNWPCLVGSGECSRPTVRGIDNGIGEYCYLCKEHSAEWDRTEVAFRLMDDDQFAKMEEIISRLE